MEIELDNTTRILHVATGDYDLVKELLEMFNRAYNSKFKYLSSEEIDGVMFSYIDASEVSIDQIFLFGSSYGDKVKELRDKKEIDW
jgi:hypothetical protein